VGVKAGNFSDSSEVSILWLDCMLQKKHNAIMLHKIIIIIMIIFTSSAVLGQSVISERRIEEEKRSSLQETVPPSEYSFQKETRKPSQEIDYYERLMSKPVASWNDGVQVIFELISMDEEIPDYPQRMEYLKQQDILPAVDYPLAENTPLRKGEAAYMLCKALGIKGGVHMRLFGVSQRYALREMVFEGIMVSGGVAQYVSGKELTLIFLDAVDYLSRHQEVEQE
jgi:hypothetical protein